MYKTKKQYLIVQLLLFSLGFVLTLIRWLNAFNSDLVVINPEITSHITNFSLSLLTYLAIGSLWLALGLKFRFAAALGAFMIAANFICETLLSSINTTDIIDAIYGTVGVILAFIYFYFASRYGLIKNSPDDKQLEKSKN